MSIWNRREKVGKVIIKSSVGCLLEAMDTMLRVVSAEYVIGSGMQVRTHPPTSVGVLIYVTKNLLRTI